MSSVTQRYSVVVPTIGRDGLHVVLRGLHDQRGGTPPTEVVVVDDRPRPDRPLRLAPAPSRDLAVRVVPGYGRGPAAARNLGWRVTTTEWVVFLDDDIELPQGWQRDLEHDLSTAHTDVAGVQGRIIVPLPGDRRPTDWERSTAGLADACWATADMACRRSALEAVHGFDERFPRAYREDADLALRLRRAGWRLVRGGRTVRHPVRKEDAGISVRVQRGNADDALMRRLHGRHWRRDARTGRGRLPLHLATLGSVAVAASGALLGLVRRACSRPASGRPVVLGLLGAAGWLGLTTDFFWRRVGPGPRDPHEVVTMLWTSAAIPPVAVVHRVRGWVRHRHAEAWPPRTRAVLFDRDGTLIHDVPRNTDPGRVVPVAGAGEALARLRAAGVRVGVVTNQAAVADGHISLEDVQRVNAQVDAELGPFDTWQVCPHAATDRCGCRKPGPGMVLTAASDLGVHPSHCVVVGDIGSDVLAARAAGATGVLVPTAATRDEELAGAPWVATDLHEAIDLVEEWSRD